MSEGRVNPQIPITPEAAVRPSGNRAYMPNMTDMVDRVRRTHGTHLALTEASAPETPATASEGEQSGNRPKVKGKLKKRVAILTGVAGVIALSNIFFGGEEEPTKTAADPYNATSTKRPGATTVPAATSASTPSQPSKRTSTGLSCNMTSIAPSINGAGNIATNAQGVATGFEATLNVQNAKNPKEIAIRAGIVVNNAIDKANVVSITRNENGTYHIDSPIPDTIYGIYAQEGSQSEICGAFKFSETTPQSVSESTVPPTL